MGELLTDHSRLSGALRRRYILLSQHSTLHERNDTRLSPPGFLFLVLVIPAQPHLESARWWWSAPIVALLEMTPEQSMAVEMVYEEGLPARMRAGEQSAALEDQIRDVDRWATSDDEFYSVTADLTRKLGEARIIECDLRRQMLDSTNRALTPDQRQRLADLIRRKRVMESTCPATAR